MRTLEQVAKLWAVSVGTIRRMIARGELRAVRIAGQFRIRGYDVECYEKNHMTFPDASPALKRRRGPRKTQNTRKGEI